MSKPVAVDKTPSSSRGIQKYSSSFFSFNVIDGSFSVSELPDERFARFKESVAILKELNKKEVRKNGQASS